MTAGSGRDEFGTRRRVCRTVDSEEEAKRLDAKPQNDVCEGRHVKPSGESMPDFCRRYLVGPLRSAGRPRAGCGYLADTRPAKASKLAANCLASVAARRS